MPATPITPPQPEATPSAATPEIFGETTTPDAVVEAINKRLTRRNYALPVGIVISGCLLAASVPWPIVAVIGVLSAVLFALQQQRSKYSALVYGNEEETTQCLDSLQKALCALRSANSVWSVREANYANGLTAHPPTLSRTKIGAQPPPLPKYLHANVMPAALGLADGALYFFPDRLFIWHSGRFSAIDYGDLKLRFRRVTFLEREEQPLDASLESQMRCSLATESTIPILYYGLVEIDAAPALKASLLTSRVESAREFVKQIQALASREETTEGHEAAELLYTHYDAARTPLFYNLTNESIQQLRAIREAFEIIPQCDYVWRYEGEEITDDWKRNAGAGALVVRSRVSPILVDSAPGFDSNVAFGIDLSSDQNRRREGFGKRIRVRPRVAQGAGARDT